MSAVNDYSAVTETPEVRITQEALEMQVARYSFAAEFCKGGDVLEVACGVGTGLGYLLQKGARSVVGGDISRPLLSAAASNHKAGVRLLQLDAQILPFTAASFDVLLLYEALYYISNHDLVVAEAERVLRPGGHILICSVNCEWSDFNPSPYSTRYLSAREIEAALTQHGFHVQIYAGFSALNAGPKATLISLARRAARNARLIPGTMKGKQWLKRLFFGPLQYSPRELSDGLAEYHAPAPLSKLSNAGDFKIIYAVGVRQ